MSNSEISAKLGAVSSNLRRVSIFSQDELWLKRQPLIQRFLDDSRQSLEGLSKDQMPAYQTNFEGMKESFRQIAQDFPRTLVTPLGQKVWCEQSMTLSLRLQHLSQAIAHQAP